MGTYHPRVPNILLPGDGGAGEGGDDVVDVTTQISNNFSLLASLVGFVRFTTAEGKPNTNNYNGKIAQEIDTGNIFVYDGAQWQILPGSTFYCTSGTRPTGASYTLYDGLIIYETDTKYTFRYDLTNARWVWASPQRIDALEYGTAGLPLILRCGSEAGAVNATGDITFNFKKAFPNGVIVVECINGDYSSGLVEYGIIGKNVNNFSVRAWKNGAVAPNATNVRCDYIAIGY